MSTISKLTPKQRKIFKKLVSFDVSNILEILRWDILSKEFAKLLYHNAWFMDAQIKCKSTAGDIGLNAIQFKPQNRKQKERFRK